MKLHRTTAGVFLERDGAFYRIDEDWNTLINRDALSSYLHEYRDSAVELEGTTLAPIEQQEVWAAGVTYERSREARVEESESAASVYDRVYEAERPELFFKANAWRVRGPGEDVRIRRDSKWNVPEPEVAVCINRRGDIVGYTIGNDMSSRDIEGDNPLYLPQAKIYDGSCALGPALLIVDELPRETNIVLQVLRDDVIVFEGGTVWSRMRRDVRVLAAYLYRETSFPEGCILLTGTGVVPPSDFTLHAGDEIAVTVAAIGTLRNTVATTS